MTTISDQITQAFCEETKFNKWFHEPSISVHIRASVRIIKGTKVRTAELANISSSSTHNLGVFLKVLRALEQTDTTVFVENVLECRLIPILKRLGYKQATPEGVWAPCFYKLQHKEKAT